MDSLINILAHYGHLGLSFIFAAILTAVIVLIMVRVFQPFVLSMLDELRDTTRLFRDLLGKKTKTDSDKELIGRLAQSYAIAMGAFFIGIMMLLSDLATPVG